MGGSGGGVRGAAVLCGRHAVLRALGAGNAVSRGDGRNGAERFARAAVCGRLGGAVRGVLVHPRVLACVPQRAAPAGADWASDAGALCGVDGLGERDPHPLDGQRNCA